jgi:antirestriction protein
MTDTAKLYVGTYHKYNCGSIAGAWVDLSDFADADAFFEHIKELHKDEADPEYMFQDYEGFPESLYSESCSTKEIELLIEYANLDESEQEIVNDYLDAAGYSAQDCDFQNILDRVVFSADPDDSDTVEAQYGYQAMLESDIPEWAQSYFDYSHYGEELCFDYIAGEKYIFSND